VKNALRRVSQWTTIAVGVFAALLLWQSQSSSQATITSAESLLINAKPNEALRVLGPLLQTDPPDGSACFFAGMAHARLQQFDAAVDCFCKVPGGHAKRFEACLCAGDLYLLKLHQLSKAESLLREALSLRPDNHDAQGHLAGLYGLCGLPRRSTQLRLERLYAGQFADVDLLLLALGDTAAENADSLNDYVRRSPHDPLVMIARAHQAWQHNDHQNARTLYEQGLSRRPDLDDAQAKLGRILCDLCDEAAFLRWHDRLCAAVGDQSETWVVRGDWSLAHDDASGAARCYWEATRRDATNRRAHHRLGQVLSKLGESNLAESFQRRNAQLQELLIVAKQTNLGPTPNLLQSAAARAQECSHPWEAWGWAEVMKHRFPRQESIPSYERPAIGTPRVLPTAQPGLSADLSHYSLPRWMTAPVTLPATGSAPPAVATNDGADIRFGDDASRTGLQFQYFNGDHIPGSGMRVFQFTGGGVGAVDYDRDGWVDLYFTQGGKWPVPESNPPSDVLFRNRAGEQFEDVSLLAGIIETDYSQGLAMGDIDSDGWADIFVANVAGNRLFRNNGDGTFEDVSLSAGVVDMNWSTGAVIADFNGDGLPDLYVINYLAGPDLLDRICRQSNGMPRACTPHEFDAADDQLLLNLGDGSFRDVSSASGILAHGGKGLGSVAADFDGSRRLGLFVSNDTTANFFFQNATPNPGDTPRLEETAIVNGTAFDREGKSQACMGIAIDDANGDGQLDLFVTNYFDEANTLYERQAEMLFVDNTAAAGLREPSLKQLGFGTQFLDADLDGWPDLVVTNGHVDDETDKEVPLHMPCQFFRNKGHGKFLEVSARRLGPWFEGKYLGRGLARLDWNRDGRDDFVVSHLDSPAALLTNESPRRGHFLTLRLIGTVSAREPIGTTVRVRTADRTIVRQLTAGDGYMACNEPQLNIGVGPDGRVDMVIDWPSGRQDHMTDVATDTTWIAIEGRGSLVQVKQ
jgi:tetratricopeptide (TPR) repeat protein